MENICNDVSRNLMLFGLVNQKATVNGKKLEHQKAKPSRSFNASPTQKDAQSGEQISTQALIANYLKTQKEVQRLEKAYNIQAKSSNTSETAEVSKLIDNSIFKKKDKKPEERTQNNRSNNTFNILGMFKPGEFLDSITTNELTSNKNKALSHFA